MAWKTLWILALDLRGGGGKLSSNAHLGDFVKNFFESIKRYRNKCGMTQSRELTLVNSELTNNKQLNDNKVNSPLSWIIASLGQVAHFTSVVIRNVLATSGWVRSAHTAPYAKSAHNSQFTISMAIFMNKNTLYNSSSFV